MFGGIGAARENRTVNMLHDLAWIAPGRVITPDGWRPGTAYRLIGSRDTVPEIDELARRYLRRFNRELAVMTLRPDGSRYRSRGYRRRWRWWPFAVRVIPYSALTGRSSDEIARDIGVV